MKTEIKLREIEKCKKLLEGPLGYNQRLHIEYYLKSLEEEDLK